MREIGPKLNDPPMNSEEILRSLRLAKRKGIKLSTIARYAGIRYEWFARCQKAGYIGDMVAGKISWVLRAINAGDLIAVYRTDRRSPQDLMIASDWLELTPTPRVVKCICGRYERCPCGLAQPEIQATVKCRSLHSGVAIQSAVESMIQANRNHVVRTADQKKPNGFRFGSPSARSAPKSTAMSGRWPNNTE